MSRLPIILPTLEYPPDNGGISRYLSTVTTVLGNDIQVLIPPDKQTNNTNLQIKKTDFYFKIIRPKWLRLTYWMIKNKKKYRSVLVSHVLPVGSAVSFASFFTQKPFGVILHGLDVSFARRTFLKRYLFRAILRKASLVVANSKSLADELKTIDGIEKVLVIPPTIILPETPSVHHAEAPWCVFLTVSRLVPRKGHQRVFRALSELKKTGQISSFTYVIVGGGPHKETLENKVIEFGLTEEVVFYGSISDEELARVYRTADVFIMPTVVDQDDREGFGYVYLEAALNSLPSIATNQPGVNEAVIDNETGILVQDGNHEKLMESILHLYNNPTERRQMGLNGQQRVFRDFSAKQHIDCIRDLL